LFRRELAGLDGLQSIEFWIPLKAGLDFCEKHTFCETNCIFRNKFNELGFCKSKFFIQSDSQGSQERYLKEAKRFSGPKTTLRKVRSLRNVTSLGAALIRSGNTNEKALFNPFA